MDLLEVLRMPLLSFNFLVIYIIHKILVLLKNYLNYLKYSIFECFFKEYNTFFLKKIFSQFIMMESLSLEEENIIKDVGTFFRQKNS